MPTITIPLATPADAEVLKALCVDAFTPNYEKYGHYPHGVDTVDWHREQAEKGYYQKVLWGDDLVGGICVDPYPEDSMKVDIFFIGSQYQGKKIGSTVLGLIEEQYDDVRKWFLSTPSKDYGNHYLYEKHGYVKKGEFCPMKESVFTLFEYEKKMYD